MQITIKIDPKSTQSLQNQIFENIRNQILEGSLKPGMMMPSSRQLHEQLGVSRNTIILTYDRLIDEGYLFSQKTIGTFVNPNLPEDSLILGKFESRSLISQPAHTSRIRRHRVAFDGRKQTLFNPYRNQLDIDFWVGRPDPDSFPINIWRRLMQKNLLHSGANMTVYHESEGIYSLRKAIADHVQPARGIACRPEQVIIVSGIQQGLNLVSRVLIKKGTSTVVECPCYQGAAYVLESYGAKLIPVKVDENGLSIEQLPKTNICLAYVTPSHQYPMGATLPLQRRVQLLEWAYDTGAYILEDDYDSDFRHQGSPLTAVAGQDKYGHVIYMGTFSKSIGAALRLGYLIVPDELIEPFRTAKTLMDNGHPWLDQIVLKDFITEGHYIKHLRRIRKTYLRRRDCLVGELKNTFGDVKLSGLDGGMHLVWHIPKSLPNAKTVQKIVQDAGVGIYSLPAAATYDFGMNHYSERTILLGYSSTNEKKIIDGIKRISNALSDYLPTRIRFDSATDELKSKNT